MMKRNALSGIALLLVLCMTILCACSKQNEDSPVAKEKAPAPEQTQATDPEASVPTDSEDQAGESGAEGNTIYASGCMPSASAEFLTETTPVLLRGEVVEEQYSRYSNPDDDPNVLNEAGDKVINSYDTYYTVKVNEVYKGSVDGTYVTVKTRNRLGLPAEEDDSDKYVTDQADFNLHPGSEMLLCLSHEDVATPLYEEEYTYICYYGTLGAFYKVQDPDAQATTLDAMAVTFENSQGERVTFGASA